MRTLDPSIKHRSCFDVLPCGDGDAMGALADVVVTWLLSKEEAWEGSAVARDLRADGAGCLFRGYRQPEGYAGGLWTRDTWPALASASFTPEGEREPVLLVVEYDEPDGKHADRRWHNCVSLERLGSDGCRVNVQVSCRFAEGAEDTSPAVIPTPRFVREMAELRGFDACVGPTLVSSGEVEVTNQNFDRWAELLQNPRRELPIVLFCADNHHRIPEHVTQLARRSLGVCGVYVLDWANAMLRERLFGLFAKETPSFSYACMRGSARLYLPGVDLNVKQGSRRHPYYQRENLVAMKPSEFAGQVVRDAMAATDHSREVLTLKDLERVAG